MEKIVNVSKLAVVVCGLMALVVAGCGGGGGSGGGTGRATIVLSNDTPTRSADSEAVVFRGATSGSPVPIADIESLTLTVTEIVLQRCDSDDDEDGADELETVLVQDFEFDPTGVVIEQGGTVRYVWTEDTLHTITSGHTGDGDAGSLFDESADTAGTVIELIFEDTGLFPYFSNTDADINEGMAGTVEVVPEDDDDGDDDGEGGGGEDSDTETGGHVTVFTGSFDVNLLDLSTISEVLASELIPTGRYCKIRMRIENPRLVLVADPATTLMNVHLTANGRIFIKRRFEVADGEEVLLVLNFGGLHLIDAGTSGQYVLTPQVHVDVDDDEAETSVEGEIISLDCDAGILVVRTPGGDEFEAMLDGDTQYRDELDNEVTCAFFAVGNIVEVEGTLTLGGIIDAHEVELEVEDDI